MVRIQAFVSLPESVVRIQAFARASSGGGEKEMSIVTEKARLASLDDE